jgi:fructosamine-3-kinase
LSGPGHVFVKRRRDAPRGFFAAEADGLDWLRSAGALHVPAVVSVADDHIAIERIDTGPATPASDERLGRGLAALHAAGAPSFGYPRDNWVGDLPQRNGACSTWAEFYATRRLLPLARTARDRSLLTADETRSVEAVCADLHERSGPEEPPARLHGDLWSGNVLVDRAGVPWLIDPAVYGGHREVDLAMMQLFGGFSARVFAAYAEAWPLADGHKERVALYQLYPLLVHVLLFGGAYARRAGDAVDRIRRGG